MISPISKEVIKGLFRNARNGGYRSAWGYLRSAEIWRQMPSLVRNLPVENFEIHVLSGTSRLTMALWMMASWISATERHWKFVIHDDGSLCPDDAIRVTRVLPHSKVILSKDSNPVIDELLSMHPLCLRCRNLHPLGRKLFDVPLYALHDKFISIDTDVIFFSTPNLILQWISGVDDSQSVFMEDAKEASLVSDRDAREFFKAQLKPKVNTGIIGIHKKALTLDFLEECLARTGMLQKDRWYIEQTLFALAASKFSKVHLLPAEYVMTLDSKCPSDAVARHYVGAVRHFFYSEGLARTRAKLQL